MRLTPRPPTTAHSPDAASTRVRRDRWRGFLRQWAGVVLLGTVSLLGIAKVGEDVFAHESTSFDGAIQAWTLMHQYPLLVRVFTWITILGGPVGMAALTAAGAGYLWSRRERVVAAAALAAPAVAVALFSVVKAIYARPRPAGLGGIVPSSYSFPSGHATAAAAVCGTLAFIFWREGLVGRGRAVAFAVLAPVLIGFSRIYLNVHWATDVLGGWSAGLLIAVLAAVLHDRNRARRVATGPTPL